MEDKQYIENLKEAIFWNPFKKKIEKAEKDSMPEGTVPSFVKAKCKGYADCIDVCPVDAVTGNPDRRMIKIDLKKCIRCGACVEVCKAKAIVAVKGK